MERFGLLFVLSVMLATPLTAQAPTGSLAGTVTDQLAAALPGATVTVTHKNMGASRVVQSGGDGTFTVQALLPGAYDVAIELSGFQPTVRLVDVVTGATTTVKATLQVSTRTEVVTVTATTMDLDTNRVQGAVARPHIESLPLNGRSFINLAVLQPGVTVVAGHAAQFNSVFNVSVLGGPASRTAITVDGGNVRNPVEGGVGQNFSQEVVQEFQISTANFDLSTGIAAFGAINIVTRSGSNALRGAGYYFFRNDTIAAFPSLARSPLTDHPEFSRHQGGFVIGGPITKDRVHFFGNYERTNQNSVFIVQPDLPSVAGFATLAPGPYLANQFNGRVDYRINNEHSLFGRYSHDGNTSSGPLGVPMAPSNFLSNENHVNQQLVGLTSIPSGTMVNDLRVSHMYWRNRNTPAACEGDPNVGNCIGTGGPEIFYLDSVNFTVGNNANAPQGRDIHRYQISNNTTWQKGTHQVKFGGTFERIGIEGYWGFFDPARVYLLSPEFLAGVGVPPSAFGLPDGIVHSYDDLKKLPVVAFLLGIGDPRQPSYNGERARNNNRFHAYVQDAWKVTPTFTLNYGLGWEHETNTLNYDLPKPAYLEPLYGSDLGGTKKEYQNFAPAAGFAWSVGNDRPTVIRGGAGIFYDTQLAWWRFGERAAIGGSGRQFIGNAAVTNPANGQPFSTAFLNSLQYTYGDFLTHLPALRAQQDAKYPGTGTGAQMLLSKQANALGALFPRDFPTTRARHLNIGLQRELNSQTVLSADFVHRKMIHGTPVGALGFGASVDRNRFDAIDGPVIPRCASAEDADPTAQCSAGPINFWWAGAEATYKGLLVKVDKRLSNGYQFSVSYALQSSHSILDVTQNLDDYFATYGPDLPRHNLTASGTVELPWRVQLSVLSTFLSHPPVVPIIGGVDNTGTNVAGTAYTPLLGILGKGYAGFLSRGDLHTLVNEYNSTYAGTPTPAAKAGLAPDQRFPAITLPADYQLGDFFSSQDLRVMKAISLSGRTELRLIGEVFNILNTSNLTNFNLNLLVPSTFGKANQRVGQTFGSGGPRAFQVAGRVSF